MLLEIKFSLSK